MVTKFDSMKSIDEVKADVFAKIATFGVTKKE